MKIKFYQTLSGKSPVLDVVDELSNDDQTK